MQRLGDQRLNKVKLDPESFESFIESSNHFTCWKIPLYTNSMPDSYRGKNWDTVLQILQVRRSGQDHTSAIDRIQRPNLKD